MEKNPATDATVPKHKKQKREIWTAEMLMQALDANVFCKSVFDDKYRFNGINRFYFGGIKMNISLLEPIGISQAMIEDFSKGLKGAGHSFTYYDTITGLILVLILRMKASFWLWLTLMR